MRDEAGNPLGGGTGDAEWEDLPTASPVPPPRGFPASSLTTDPQDELFDVLDRDGQPTGIVKTRGEVHRDGDWHGALHIWVGGMGEDGVPFVIFQRRSLTKDTWPGYLDTAIGGHIRSGETLEETIREAEEEIGLAVTLERLTLVGRRFVAGRSGTVDDREAQTVFAVRSDRPLSAYRMHPEEVAALVAIPIDAALALFAGQIDSLDGVECPREGEAFPVTLARIDFAQPDLDYPRHALPALRAVIEGQTPPPFTTRTTLPDEG